MKIVIKLIVLFLVLGCDHPESNNYSRDSSSLNSNLQNRNTDDSYSSKNTEIKKKYKVIGIKDGDTFEVLVDGISLVVRFAHIDCPEKKQPYGKKAKQYVSSMCFGDYISLKHSNKFDRNGRLIAEVILNNGNNLNKLLVQNGLAWHYKKYSKDNEYAIIENKARLSMVGLWADTNPVAPWEWRK